MSPFTPTELRTLGLAVGLLGLATGARLLLAPGASEFAWSPTAVVRPSPSIDAALRAVEDTLARAEEARRPLAPGEKIDVNRADAVQLQRLPGVGPARAVAIIREREAGGAFRSAAELERVTGVGPAMVERWRDVVSFGGAVPRHSSSQPPARIDLNRAHPKELEQITGIGPELASEIFEARTRQGRFRTVEDLLLIPGIGPKTLEKVREQAFVR